MVGAFGSSRGRAVTVILGGLLMQGPAGAPAGVIIEKTELLRVSTVASRLQTFGWNVFTLYYPTHSENVIQYRFYKHFLIPVKAAWGVSVWEYPRSAGRKATSESFFLSNENTWNILVGAHALLLFTCIFKSCDSAISGAEKSPAEIAFQFVLYWVSCFTAHSRSPLSVSVWSWCRQAVTFGLKYIMVTHPPVYKLCYWGLIQTWAEMTNNAEQRVHFVSFYKVCTVKRLMWI